MRGSHRQTDRETGAAAVEYALLVALIIAVVIGGASLLGVGVASSMTAAGDGFGADGSTTTTVPVIRERPVKPQEVVVRSSEAGGEVRIGK